MGTSLGSYHPEVKTPSSLAFPPCVGSGKGYDTHRKDCLHEGSSLILSMVNLVPLVPVWTVPAVKYSESKVRTLDKIRK